MINVLLECIKLLSVHINSTYLAVCSIREHPSDIVLFFIIITAMFALLLQEVCTIIILSDSSTIISNNIQHKSTGIKGMCLVRRVPITISYRT